MDPVYVSAMPSEDIVEQGLLLYSNQSQIRAVDIERAPFLRENGVLSLILARFETFCQRRKGPASHYTFLLTIRGGGRIRFDDAEDWKALRPGNWFLAPDRPHTFENTEDRWEALIAELDLSLVWEGQGMRDPKGDRARFQGQIRTAVEEILRELKNDNVSAERIIRLYEELFVNYLRRELTVELPPRAAEVMKKMTHLWEKIDDDLGHEWTVAEMSDILDVSPNHLNRLATRYWGAKPSQVLHRLRMRRAEDLLRNTNQPLRVIAQRVGYKHPFSFSDAFLRYSGIRPREFRNKQD